MSDTTNIEVRLTTQEWSRIEFAAGLSNEPVSNFVVRAANERANDVIEDTSTTVVPAEYFDRLLTTIDEPDPAPGYKTR